MNYYFTVKETEKHDQELGVYEADNLEEAKKMFAMDHPEDVENIISINREGEIVEATE